MKGIKFDSQQEAMNWDSENNGKNYTGNRTKYLWHRTPLKTTSSKTKVQYALLMGISATIETEEGTIANPAYTSLPASNTTRNFALMVGDDLAEVDAEGNKTYSNNEIEITEDMRYTGDAL